MSDSNPSNLSPNINLEFLRKEAKALLKRCRAGDAQAASRIGAQLPRQPAAADMKLADVQHALARELGFANWAALKRHDDPVERFLVAVRGGDLKDARRELSSFAEMAEENIHAACAIGDPDAAAHHLNINAASLTAEHNGWPPLLYACATPLNRATARQSAAILQCVTLLLDRGADPNTFTLTNPLDPESKLTACYRAMMSGNVPVVTLLMQRGAKMDSMERPPIEREQPAMAQIFREFLQIPEVQRVMPERMAQLQQQGKLWGSDKWWFHARPELPAIAINVHRPLLERGMDPNRPSREGLTVFQNVVRTGTVEMVELYLQYGADLNRPTADGRTPLALAVRAGRNLVADSLRAHGASEAGLRGIDELIGACLRVDEADVKSIVSRNPDAAQQISAEDFDILVQAAAMNIGAQVEIMAKCGFDLGGFSENGLTALHAAAWHGQLDMVRALLSFHAPVNVRDHTYGSSALAWAAHGSKNCRNDDDAYCAIVLALRDAGADYKSAISRAGVQPETLATERVATVITQAGT